MENFSVLYFSRNFPNIFDLIIKSLLNEINLFPFDILPQNIDKLKFIVIGVTIHSCLHGSDHITSFIGHVVADIQLSLKGLNEGLSF
jgi:hypothetical protein